MGIAARWIGAWSGPVDDGPVGRALFGARSSMVRMPGISSSEGSPSQSSGNSSSAMASSSSCVSGRALTRIFSGSFMMVTAVVAKMDKMRIWAAVEKANQRAFLLNPPPRYSHKSSWIFRSTDVLSDVFGFSSGEAMAFPSFSDCDGLLNRSVWQQSRPEPLPLVGQWRES